MIKYAVLVALLSGCTWKDLHLQLDNPACIIGCLAGDDVLSVTQLPSEGKE